MELQAKLLRVLKTGEFTTLGSEKSIKANVRELKNTLLYALTIAIEKLEIDRCDLPNEIIENPFHINESSSTIPHIKQSQFSQKLSKETLKNVLVKYDYVLVLAAEALNMSRTTLWRYRKKLGL